MKLTRLCAIAALAVSIPALACEEGTEPGAAGTITVTSTAIANQSGKVLVVHVQREGGGENVGRACVPITSSSFALPPTAVVESSSNPCDPAGAAKTFAPGRYTVSAGVYTPGSTVPERSSTVSVEVSGDVTASVDGAALSG